MRHSCKRSVSHAAIRFDSSYTIFHLSTLTLSALYIHWLETIFTGHHCVSTLLFLHPLACWQLIKPSAVKAVITCFCISKRVNDGQHGEGMELSVRLSCICPLAASNQTLGTHTEGIGSCQTESVCVCTRGK